MVHRGEHSKTSTRNRQGRARRLEGLPGCRALKARTSDFIPSMFCKTRTVACLTPMAAFAQKARLSERGINKYCMTTSKDALSILGFSCWSWVSSGISSISINKFQEQDWLACYAAPRVTVCLRLWHECRLLHLHRLFNCPALSGIWRVSHE